MGSFPEAILSDALMDIKLFCRLPGFGVQIFEQGEIGR